MTKKYRHTRNLAVGEGAVFRILECESGDADDIRIALEFSTKDVILPDEVATRLARRAVRLSRFDEENALELLHTAKRDLGVEPLPLAEEAKAEEVAEAIVGALNLTYEEQLEHLDHEAEVVELRPKAAVTDNDLLSALERLRESVEILTEVAVARWGVEKRLETSARA